MARRQGRSQALRARSAAGLAGELPADRVRLAGLPPAARRAALVELLRLEVARAARVPAARVTAATAPVAAGIDSLAAVELAGVLEERLAVPLSLADVLDAESIAELADRLAAATAAATLATVAEDAGPGAAEQAGGGAAAGAAGPAGGLPLSASQRALWFLHRLSPGSAAYNLAAAVRLAPPLDRRALARAFAALCARHPVLRTTFGGEGAEPWQRVHPRLGGAWIEIDARGWSEPELASWLAREAVRPFDLAGSPPVRATLLARARGGGETGEGAVLLLAAHHLAADFWSLAVAVRELGALYDRETGAGRAALPPVPRDYGDFVRWQRRLLAGPAGDRLWDFWRARLAGAPFVLELATDRPRPAAQSDRGGAVAEPLDRAAAAALRSLARGGGATVFAAALAGFAALLQRLTGQAEVVVGAPAAGRTGPEWSGVVGYFVNPLPLRLGVAPAASFAELLARTRRTATDALAHQDFPFAWLAERLQPQRDPSRSPIFQAMFQLQRSPLPGQEGLAALALGWPGARLDLGGLRGESLAVPVSTAQLDLSLGLGEVDGSPIAVLRFSADLFDPATARRMLGHYQALLAGAALAAGRPLADLPLLSAAEAWQLLGEWNDTGGADAAGDGLYPLFAAQAAATPDAVALSCGSRHLTYGELEQRARRLAGRLQALGIGVEARVGVLVERTPEMVVALLGVLAAGAAYVPLDPAYPRPRLAWMLGDSAAAALCTGQRHAEIAAAAGVPAVDLDAPAPAAVPAAVRCQPRQLAYVLYTSGSTGTPKGVAIEQRSAVALVRWAWRAFSPAETARVLAATSICFDLSVFELFVPLLRGGTVVLARDLMALAAGSAASSPPAAADPTLINTVPSVLAELLALRPLPPSVRVVNLAGEPLPRALVELLAVDRTAGERRVCNLYGPSEDTTYSTCEAVALAEPAPPAIGRPISSSRAYVLDAARSPLPAGVPGELHLAGAGLARGYWNRPELTAERFLPDPFGGEPGGRLYATGDLAAWLPDGRLRFLGRRDHQVKLRGFRIELGEIEACLRALAAVAEAAVAVQAPAAGGGLGAGEQGGPGGLVAYVVPRRTPGPPAAALRQALAAALPAYMVPATFVELPALPRTASGKLDRGALPAPALCPAPAAAPPRGVAEELLAELWCEVLDRPRVGRDDHFFHLGGHSLLALRLASRVERAFGVELPLRALFEHPTLRAQAERIVRGRVPEASEQPPLAPVPRDGPLPLSFAQLRLWFLQQLEPGSAAYNLPAAVRLVGPLRPAVLGAAFDEIVRRHEPLRTRAAIAADAGEPRQEILAAAAAALPLADLGALPAAAAAAESERLVRQQAWRPFRLDREPPLRLLLLRRAEREHLLLATLHHIAADGWSLGVLLDELAELYDALDRRRIPRLPPLPVQYADFAVWQRACLAGEALRPQLDYWRRQLAGLPALDLPADRQRPRAGSWRGAAVACLLPPPLAAALHRLAREESATFFMVLLAGLQALLGRVAGQDDFAVGAPVAGRRRVELEPLLGLFVNTLVLRAGLAGDPDGRALLGRIRETSLAAHEHQDLPFEKLVEELRPGRDLSRSPLVQVLLAMQNVPLTRRDLGALALHPARVDAATARFDLSLLVAETGAGWQLTFEYARDLFDRPSIVRLAGHCLSLLAALAADPARRVGALPLLGAAERHQLVAEWNDTGAAWGEVFAGACLHRLLAAQARSMPRAVAVAWEGAQLLYGELDRLADRLARRLRRLGLGPESVAGICAERSPELVIGLLAILKAGAAYLPLDPEYPDERLAFMLADAGAPVVLVQPALAGRLAAVTAVTAVTALAGAAATPVRLVPLAPLAAAPAGAAAAGAADPAAGGPAPGLPTTAPRGGRHGEALPESPAYVIYTSGSTGRPKGVVNTHRAIVNRLLWMQHTYGLTAGDRVLQKTPVSFDVSVWELFWPLLTGARLVLAQPGGHRDNAGLIETIAAAGITTLHFVPAMLEAFLEEPGLARCAGLRRVIVSGEALSPELARRFLARLGEPLGVELHNLYGPTEAAVDVTSWPCREVMPGGVPIGRPIANLEIHLLDRQGQPAPVGVAAELHIGGVGLARGYLRRPELTASSFVPDPLGRAGARLYRTGDLARRLPGGEIVFLGRLDHQVKVRGVRIELGEIETALAAEPDVRQAVVTVWEPAPGDRRLAAYVVPRQPPGPSPAELRARLAARLPAAMVPAEVVLLAALPLNASGKVDRRALPAPAPRAGAAAAAPLTLEEELLAGLWAEALGRESVAPGDNFFDLGGHSLLAVRLLARLRAARGIELPVRALFEAPTLAAFAARVAAARRTAAPSPAPPLVPAAGRDGPLPLSFAQQRLWFLHQLEPESPRYNLAGAVRLAGALAPERLRSAFAEVVRRHEALRTRVVQHGGRPAQEIGPAAPPTLPRIDLSALAVPARREVASLLARQEAERPFDLAGGQPWRIALLVLARDEHLLLVTLHHIVADGWSLGVLLAEIAETYGSLATGRALRLPRLPVQYADYAAWQRRRLSGEVLARLLEAWRARLAGLPVLELPADRPRSAARGSRGGSVEWLPPAPLGTALRRLARGEGATLFMVALAGFAALAGRLSGEPDFAIGTPIAGRDRTEIEPLIGCFVNTLALRIQVDGGTAFRDLLAQVREVALEAYALAEMPFDKLVEELRPERDLARPPLVQVLCSLQNAPLPAVALPGLALELAPVPLAAARFELSLALGERGAGAGLGGTLAYAAELFDRATVRRWGDALERLLAAAAARPELPLAQLPLLSPAARWQLVAECNDTDGGGEIDAAGCLPRRFLRTARRAPDAIAVRWIGGEPAAVSFGELDRRSERLARRLRRAGVGPETPVAVYAEPALELLTGLLGILRAGGAYLPLDPADPPPRLAWVLADARPPVLLAQRHLLARLQATAALPLPSCLLPLDEAEAGAAALPDREEAAGGEPASPLQLACVFYTSGSTGRPKGVLVEHRGLANYLDWAAGHLLGAGAVAMPLLSRISFDASVKQLFAPLVAGHAVHLLSSRTLQEPAALLRALAEVSGLALNCVPSLWEAMAAALARGEAEPPPGIRRLILGGDRLSGELAARSLGLLPDVELHNVYGPTETTVNASRAIVRDPGRVTLGRPIANVRLHVVDRDLGLAPHGAPGELCIGGAGVARGFLGQPERTAERFVPDPWSPLPGSRLYRSGDLARRLPDGEIEFLGRLDRQVKIRGLRIELGEIEAALAAHPAVREAAVLHAAPQAGAERLAAWYSAHPGALPAAGELRDFVRGRLPEAWVPAAFIRLDRLPRLPSGKLDRRALAMAAPPQAREAAAEREPTPSEEIVAGIYAQLLGVDGVGRDDDFFALGGHSLLATQLVSRLRTSFGLELPLRSVFDAPTPAGIARQLDEGRRTGAEPPPPLAAGPRGEPVPLSFAQQQLWLVHQLDPGSPAYNLPASLRLTGRLDVAALARALAELARRHDVLRTTFPPRGLEPAQEVGVAPSAALPVVDLSALPAAEAEAGRLAAARARLPFDLARGPLWRSVLLRLGGERHRLLLELHHIVADGWSLGVMVRELGASYQAARGAPAARLAELPLQYADYARWQRAWMSGAVLEGELAWWRERLAGARRTLSLPGDRPPAPVPAAAGAIHAFVLPLPVRDRLAASARRQGVTLFMALLASFAILLRRLTGQDDVLVGSPVAGRHRTELEGLIGCFVNLLVLRLQPRRGDAVADLVRQARETALDAYAHQDLPFVSLVEGLGGERRPSLLPLVQVVFALQEAPLRRLALPGLELTPAAPPTGTAKFDLSWVIENAAEGLAVTVEYRRQLFDAATIQRWSSHFALLAAAVAADPDAPLAGLSPLAAAERAQLLVEWNDSAAASPAVPVHVLFARHAAAAPGAPAVAGGPGAPCTRRELAGSAARLARLLRGAGVGPEDAVGVCLGRGRELVAAFLGVLQAGAAYLPIDPAYPAERIALLLADARAPVLVTRRGLAPALPANAATTLWLDDEDGAGRGAAGEGGVELAAPAVAADQLAYVIYTSGSTGRPKGVEVSHRALANLAAWHCRAYGLAAGDRTTLVAGVSFDASVWEMASCLAAGACLLIPGEEARLDAGRLADWLAAEGATHCFLPTPLAEALLDAGGLPGPPPWGGQGGLRFLLTGGERLRRFRPPGTTAAVINHYGPTEGAVVASAAPVPDRPSAAGPAPATPAAPPIGRPIANTRLYVLDQDLAPVPIGAPGEVCIGGVGLARGYRHRPDLTAERFVPSPFAAGERLYRTGDLGRFRADGNLEFLGRIDDQVKVRGHRVEPGEIEAALAAHPGVRAVAVLARDDGAAGPQLVAYVVPRPPAATTEELYGFLAARLPSFMVPARFVELAALPLTPNGKIDRRALPAPERAPAGPFAAPRTAVEEVVAALWGQLLGRDRIGRDDDFFALGGHSLLAARMAARLRQVFRLDLPLASVFAAGTVAELARAVEAREPRSGHSERVARLVLRVQGMSGDEVRDQLRRSQAGQGALP